MKSRIVKDGFWSDTYVEDLDPIEKLLFLYLITNSQNNISGIYKIKHKRIAYETGIDKEMVEKIILRFKESGKVEVFEDWIILKNFHKHQNYNSPKILSGLQKIVDEFPNEIVEIIMKIWTSEVLEKLNLKFKEKVIKKEVVKSQKNEVNWSEVFEKVWKEYDFKRNKKKSEEKFLRIIRNSKKPEEVSKKIIDGIKRYNQYLESLEKKQKYDSKVFIPQKQQLVFWLNNERWNDEYFVKKQLENLNDIENY